MGKHSFPAASLYLIIPYSQMNGYGWEVNEKRSSLASLTNQPFLLFKLGNISTHVRSIHLTRKCLLHITAIGILTSGLIKINTRIFFFMVITS